jgi:DNA-binding CsgD family transcriptional regulator
MPRPSERPVNGNGKPVSPNLTPREREIGALLATDKPAARIAQELGISIHLVYMTATAVYFKTGTRVSERHPRRNRAAFKEWWSTHQHLPEYTPKKRDAQVRAFRIRLTRRECDIARRMAQGMTAKQIGAALSLRPGTIYHYQRTMYGITGSKNRITFVVWWLQHQSDPVFSLSCSLPIPRSEALQ